MNYVYEHGNTPERDWNDFWVRFETSDAMPTEADLAERDRREARRRDVESRIKGDLRRFAQRVNESFAVSVRAEFSSGAHGRRIIGRDGIERKRQTLRAVIGLGPVDAMKMPSDDEAARIGEILAAYVRRENPNATAFGYVGSAPICLIGERLGLPNICLVPTVEGLHAEVRLGMYFAPLSVKETP